MKGYASQVLTTSTATFAHKGLPNQGTLPSPR